MFRFRSLLYKLMNPRDPKPRRDLLIATLITALVLGWIQSASVLLAIGAGVAGVLVLIGIIVGIHQWLFLRKEERQRQGARRK